MELDVINDVGKVGRRLMLNSPFYGLFLSSLNKVINNNILTAGVSKNGINVQLAINEEFYRGLSENVRYGVILHEALHICLFHLNLRDKYSDKKLFNVAADICINFLIDPKYKPEWFLHHQSFGDIGLEQGQDTDYYYKKLYKEKEENPKGQLGQFLQDQEGQYSNSLANHELWKEFESLSDSEKKLVEKQIEYQLKNTAESIKNRGTIPGEMKGLLDKILNPEAPKFNWKGYLRRFAGGSSKVFTKKIRRKTSKRYEDNPGLKIKQKKHILVFNDSSGSVSDKEYTEFINEIYHISKTGTEVTIADFDTQVQNVRKFDIKKDIKRSGYGGTAFEAPVSYYNQHKNKYCSCIIFTDGECSSPSIKPLGKILWAISSTGNDNIELPGLKIKLN